MLRRCYADIVALSHEWSAAVGTVLLFFFFALIFSSGHARSAETAFDLAVPKEVQTSTLFFVGEAEGKSFPPAIAFDIDPNGLPVVADGSALRVLGSSKQLLTLGAFTFDDFAWMRDGALLFITQGHLAGVGPEGLRLSLALPSPGMRIRPAGDDTAYIFGGSNEPQNHDVYLLSRNATITKLVTLPASVTAVAGDGTTTYVATNRTVLRLVAEQPVSVIFQAQDDIISIELGPKQGLFYSTKLSVGYVASDGTAYEFMKGEGGILRARASSLFVLIPQGPELIRFSNIEGFQKLLAPLAPTPLPTGVLQPAPVTECDRLASSPWDQDRPPGVPGVETAQIDTGLAIPACRAALAEYPHERRLMFSSGRALLAGQQYDEALRLYRQAAEAGSTCAMNDLGFMYNNGLGVAKDDAEATRFFRKAADAGNSVAMNNLGIMYSDGRGVAKDEGEAVRLYRKAASAGLAVAMANLGFMYANGRGVNRDKSEAKLWYQKAADLGNKDAQTALGKLRDTVAPACPRVAGTWYSSGNKVTMVIDQEGCNIASREFGPVIFQSLTGHAAGDDFDYTLNRTDNRSNCTVTFYGRFISIREDTMTSHVYRTSGQCGFANNWTETLSWVRP